MSWTPPVKICQSKQKKNHCTLAICSDGCVNGTCTAPDTCVCNSGWNGTACNIAICTPACSNSGTCVSPNVCNCSSGWSGSTCTTPVCSSTCQNGGTCTAPNTCSCTSSYTGASCTTPVCSPYCKNGEICSAPNTCICPIGSLMILQCATSSCFYGKDTVNLVEGGQRSIEHLKVGDRIWSLNHHGTRLIEDEVIMMADNGPNKPTLFYTFKTTEGHEVSLTDNHNILVYLPNENRIVYLRASKVTLEYQLIMHHQKVKIESISQISRRGYYSPLTLSSYLLVNNISTSIFADSYHVSPEALHHIFAPIRGYYHLLRWIYGKNYDPFETNVTEGLHPLIAWMKYHQTKIRNMYLGLIYISPIISIVFIVQWFFSKICFGYDKKMDTPFF